MAVALSTHFLLFLWFSGVNQVVNPSSEIGMSLGSGMEPEEAEYQEPLAMEDRRLYVPRRLLIPLPHADPVQESLRRHYKLEDFLWTGSGDGPYPSEQDGGLAWEDNGGAGFNIAVGSQSRSWIKVTKTMTLYRTVLTTIYPVEMTPTVVSGLPMQPTPHVTPSPAFFSESISPSPPSAIMPSESDGFPLVPSAVWVVTPVFSPTPEPTQVFQISPSPTSSSSSDANNNGVQNQYSAESTARIYWIQTSIKANDSTFRDAPQVFRTSLQKNLAQVYASAFKRHLLSTLGVLPPGKNASRRRRRRRRQTPSNGDSRLQDFTEHDLHWLYVAHSSMNPSQLKHLATTAMNVTVTILNVSSEEVLRLDVKYVVLAEGSPVPAFSAVKELDLVSKAEMERVIGHEIIDKKAEALVAGPPEQMTRNEEIVATSPWLIVAVTTICLLVILLALIAFMVWKWKHNRLGDSRRLPASISARPQSGIEIEDGVINPAFHGTPSRTGRGETHHHDQSPRSSPASSLLSRARKAKRIADVIGGSRGDSSRLDEKKRRHHFEKENSPTSSEDLRLHKKSIVSSSDGSADWKALLREPSRARGVLTGKGGAATSARTRQRSPSRTKALSGAVKPDKRDSKDVLRRRRRRSQIDKFGDVTLKSDESEMSHSSMEEDDHHETKSLKDIVGPLPTRGMSDTISLGNLDICQDAIAQTPSEYARRMVPWKRPGSAVASNSSKTSTTAGDGAGRRPGSRVAPPETIDEIPSFDFTEEEEEDGLREQDRDLSERSFGLIESPGKSATATPTPDTKDAQVQTPTRISKTASHKTRAAPKPRKSWRGSPSGGVGGGPSESVISTESEEIVEVHHINSSSMSDDQNPLGRMRKRFHQFLDDAFNVMGNNKRDDSVGRGETQSAKVSISHEVVETETEWRPWTSHVVREESLNKLKRPKSAAVPIGPPKRAWTASSERRTHSAKSKGGSGSEPSKAASTLDVHQPEEVRLPARQSRQQSLHEEDDESYDKTSTPCATSKDENRTSVGGGGSGNAASTSDNSQSHSVMLSPAFIFPQYPAYPDIRIETGGGIGSGSTSGSSQSQPPPALPSNDPAVPLIQAIKDEVKRFEKDPTNQN